MEYLPFLMLPVAFALMFLGFQVAFSMMITAVLFGLVIFGDRVVFQFIEKIEDISSNFVFAAVPLFVFMGSMLEQLRHRRRAVRGDPHLDAAPARRPRARHHHHVHHLRRLDAA